MYQKLPVISLEWMEETSQFTEDCKKIYNEKIHGENSLEVSVEYPPRITRTLSERVELAKVEKLLTNSHDNKECFSQIKISNKHYIID